MINYTITRSNRRTIAIHIQNGSVSVRAPRNAPQHDIDRFIAKKEKWIIDKLALQRETATKRENFSVGYGDKIPYRGELYPIAVCEHCRIGFFDGSRFNVPPNLTPEQIKHHCQEIYKNLADSIIKERISIYIERMVILPNSVKITNAKKRWGSCSSDGNISISWRLIMASDSIIDYILVHELSHLVEMNHSARFWSVVESVLPDYKKRRAELRAFQNKLIYENWD